jgi:hypothetical protein
MGAMGFRRHKSNNARRSREWGHWRDVRRVELATIGLPPSVYADEARWLDFLGNGHLHWHNDPWRFEFSNLSPGQLAALHRFLEREYGHAPTRPALLDWLRIRVRDSGSP